MTERDCPKPHNELQRWIRFFWIALITGSVPSVLTVIFGKPTTREVLLQMMYGCIYSSSIGGICNLVLPKVAGPILRLRKPARWPAVAMSLVILASVGTFIATFLIVLLGVIRPTMFWAEFVMSLKIAIMITLVFGMSAFSREVLQERFNRASAELKKSEEVEEKLRQAATEARLSSLESRVQPHFLFNTLNSVLALIREDPHAAERMVERLAALLRFSLDANQSRLVPLALEAKIIRDYLEIEQARFGSRLRFSIEIPASLDHVSIPPMSLQTLVENCVKYAVSSRREGAFIALRATRDGQTARIEVTDDGPGFSAAPVKAGHGLELLQNRVEGLFGSNGGVEIGVAPSGGASVTVVVPATKPVEMATREELAGVAR